jgi:hypothetical protein
MIYDVYFIINFRPGWASGFMVTWILVTRGTKKCFRDDSFFVTDKIRYDVFGNFITVDLT